jgi:hypothetical protein
MKTLFGQVNAQQLFFYLVGLQYYRSWCASLF